MPKITAVKSAMPIAGTSRSSGVAAAFGAIDSAELGLSIDSEELAQLLDAFSRRVDQRDASEFTAIAHDIAVTRSELQRLGANQTGEGLPALDAELDAISRDTENATNVILGAAEAIIALGADDADIKAKADALVVQIFEACTFQDLVGQRVSKVVRVLNQIEHRVARLGEFSADADTAADIDAAEQRRRDLILHGPAICGPETSQAQIDAFFN